jgi:P2 family phage major capsid protein
VETQARQKFNAMLTGMAQLYKGHFNGSDKFSVDPIEPVLEQTLEKRIQEQSALLSKINVVGVRDLKGEKLGLLAGKRVASRTDTNQADRQTKYIGDMDGRTYELYKTDFDTHITYQQVDNWSAYPDFETLYRDKVMEQIGRDRVTVGWHGIQAAANSDPAAHPMLEDLNRGWLQAIREEKPANMLGTAAAKIKIGDGGTYKSIDTLVFDLRHTMLEPWNRNRTDLVLILGSELYHRYHMAMLDSSTVSNVERNAREEWLRNNTIGGLKVVQEEFFPERGILITFYKNLSIYYQRSSRRRTVYDNAKRDRVEDYQSVNEGYIVEDFGAVGGADSDHILLPDGNGGWA